MDKQELRKLLGEDIFSRAQRYYMRGRVTNFMQEVSAPGVSYLTAEVHGTEDYKVQVWLNEDGTYISGSCPCSYNQNGDGPVCKHIGAVLFAQDGGSFSTRQHDAGDDIENLIDSLLEQKLITKGSEVRDRSNYSSNLDMLFGSKWRGPTVESDYQAQKLLEKYRTNINSSINETLYHVDALPGSIHLEPELTPDPLRRNAAPELRLKIRGKGRSYVVKDIDAMLQAVKQKDVVRYGAELEFLHSIDAFDSESQQLIELVRHQQELLQYAGDMVRGAGRMTLRRSSMMPLAPNTCDALYMLYYQT